MCYNRLDENNILMTLPDRLDEKHNDDLYLRIFDGTKVDDDRGEKEDEDGEG